MVRVISTSQLADCSFCDGDVDGWPFVPDDSPPQEKRLQPATNPVVQQRVERVSSGQSILRGPRRESSSI